MRKPFFIFVLLSATLGLAQTAPTSLPGFGIQITTGYSLVTGQALTGGFFSSFAAPIKTFNAPWSFTISGRADYFHVAASDVNVITAGPELRYQFSRADLFNGEVFQPFFNFELGAAKSDCLTCTSAQFAFKVGGGLDMPEGSMLTWRIFEADYIHSSVFPSGSAVLSNFVQLTTGLGIRF